MAALSIAVPAAGPRGAAVSLLPLVVLLLTFVSLTACGVRPPSPDILRFALVSMPVTLDPRFATDATSSRINRLLYQRLVEFDQDDLPVPGLARWERLDARHYRFRLRDDARFSDGTLLTARDVAATYRHVLDPAHASPHRLALAGIVSIEVVDDRTVDFHLEKADPLFPGRLGLGILPARLIASDHPFNRAPVGSGPFEFVAWPAENRLRLRRRRDGQLLEFIAVRDPTVRVLKLLRGEVDMVQNDLPPELVRLLRAREDIVVRTAPGSNFAYLGFNLTDPHAGRLPVRRAVALAVDRDAIIRHVLGGAARPAVGLLPPEHWASDPDLQPLPHDPAQARVLLREAGYGEANPLRLTYKTSSDPFRLRLATIIQQQLAEVGIAVDLKSYDWGTFYGDIKAGRFQMYSLMWVGIKMPDIYRYVFHSSAVPPAGANRGRYADAETDRLIEAAETAPDLAGQARYYRRLQARLLDELPYVPLWYEDHVFAARRGIEGYRLARDGNYDGLAGVVRRGE